MGRRQQQQEGVQQESEEPMTASAVSVNFTSVSIAVRN